MEARVHHESNLSSVPPANGVSGYVIGTAPTMLVLETVIAEIARTDIPVLLIGESGTGKQMFARHIHSLSARSEAPFTKIACASMTPEALPIELERRLDGNGHTAHGTMFFDEVSDLGPACQRILLPALPDGEEDSQSVNLATRVISATTKNLEEEIRSGNFRAELFYRINGVCLRLPPLRERRKDIPRLAEYFVAKHAAQLGRPARSLSSRTIQILSEYSWPGNIRQLENIIKSVVALGDEEFPVSELVASEPEKSPPAALASDSLRAASRAASREAEKELILKALDRTRWNRKRAARDLQISYKSLLYKLKQIGAEEPDARTA